MTTGDRPRGGARVCLGAAAAVVWAALLAGCGEDAARPDARPADGPTDAAADAVAPGPDGGPDGPSRSFALASTGTQAVPGQTLLFQLTPADLATDVDVIAIHQDFYGLPWEAFLAGQPPPPEWTAIMDGLAAQAQTAGKPVFLTLQLAGGPGRVYLADKAVVQGGQLTTQPGWSARCYDFATAPDAGPIRAAYLAYVDWMVRRFAPRWVNVAVEINLFQACGAAWDGMVEVERAAYDAARAAAPGVIAFPSIQIDVLYGETACPAPLTPAECYEANYARLANLARDRFAISTYPYLLPSIHSAAEVPADWFTRAADRGGERTLVAETGWDSTAAAALLGASCFPAFAFTPADEQAYLDLVLTRAQEHRMDLVTWVSNRDLVPAPLMTDCPCTFDPTWCAIVQAFRQSGGSDPMSQFFGEMLLKIWGTMGVRAYDGTPKPGVYDLWHATQALPIVPAGPGP